MGVNSLVSEIPHIVKLKHRHGARSSGRSPSWRAAAWCWWRNPGFPAKNLTELVAYVKANPGKVNYASYSPGTLSHVLGLLLNQAAGIDLTHVGYKGSTPALADVMGDHVPLMFDGMPTSLPLIKAGKIKAFAVSTPKRARRCCRTCRPSPSSATRSSRRWPGWACGAPPTCRPRRRRACARRR